MITEEQRKDRINYIGGSDLPIIMGLSKYKTPYALFLEKKGLQETPYDETPLQYWGNRLESVVREEFSIRNNVQVEEPETLAHPFHTFLRANVDGYIPEWDAILEVKCSSAWMQAEWGEPGSDIIPMAYLVQVAHYCIVTNASCAHIAVLLGGNDYREYKYTRDANLEAMVLKAATDFWSAVQNDDAPPAVNKDDLLLMYPRQEEGKSITINPSIGGELTMLGVHKKTIKEHEKEEERHKFNVMQFMQDAETLLGEDGKPVVTWKANKKGSRVFSLKGQKDE